MSIGAAIAAGGSLLSAMLGYQTTNQTNAANAKMVEETNKSNERMADRANWFNRQIAQETNETNERIAKQNLGFQRELQEYQKAVQKEQWAREDTSYQRTAADMLAAGLNPLDMQGTDGAGEVVSMTPLNNSFQAQQSSPMVASRNEAFKQANAFDTALGASSAIASVAEAFNQIETGQLSRDSLQLENDRKYIENQILLNDYGLGDAFYKDKKGNRNMMFSYIEGHEPDFITSKGWKAAANNEEYNKKYIERLAAQREYNHKVEAGIYDSDTNYERILTAISDWIANGRGAEAMEKLKEKYPILKAFGY